MTVEGLRITGDERDVLAERAVIDQTLAKRLLWAEGFRNILVHEYAEIDPDLFFDHLQHDLPDLWQFAQALAGRLRGKRAA